MMRLISLLLACQVALGFQLNVAQVYPASCTSPLHQRYQNGASLIPRKSAEVRNLDGLSTPKVVSLASVIGRFVGSLPSTRDLWLESAHNWLESAKKVCFQPFGEILRRSWWSLPLFLALIPPLCALQGTYASMPDWWSLVHADYLRKSRHAALLVAGFLGSNIAYFGSGFYLLQRFPLQQRVNEKKVEKLLRDDDDRNISRFQMLGLWILGAGLTSTIFHSVQALGSYQIAESLCYLDHAVALTAGGYFWDTCGTPSRRVLGIGILSLVTLVLTHPGYAFLHSTWHFMSAATATLWALEGHSRIQNV
mmetsp:Transcript_14784/g.21809  ORF Transcript_14784/g.21809 Transcript_14784/m.21809 type:complete len:308 (-) Transcript_14784:204-1127(-)